MEVTALETISQINQINDLFNLTAESIRSQKPKIYSKDLVELLFVQPYCRIDNVMEQFLGGGSGFETPRNGDGEGAACLRKSEN